MAKAFRFGVVSGGFSSSTEWISFVQRVEEVQEGQIENFAPIVARLSGVS
ncbi:MAG: hypothetical protein H0U76_08155 [Ktedonobacteraceae bacterium]|nr:hypothetical protein [Ktedonobacteraceae bacterium]